MALLTLFDPVKFSATLRPVCLPANPADTFMSQMARLTGWANLRKNGHPMLLEVIMTIVECSPWAKQQAGGKLRI